MNTTNTILQFGEGNFLRCFADWMIDTMNEKANFKAEVVIIQPQPKGLVPMLKEQGNAYHTYLTEWKNEQATKTVRNITCIKDVINPYSEFSAYLNYAKDTNLKYIISNTTEAGIAFSDETYLGGVCPTGFPAKLTVFLLERFKTLGTSAPVITVLACELIENNGAKLRACIIETAKHWELSQEFINWVDTHQVFCNTLVDRIVPGFPHHNKEDIWKEIGQEDNLVTTGEGYHLWGIEGSGDLQERFPTKAAGLNVLYVDDLKPFRDRKVRILNGAHTATTSLGLVYGIETVNDVFNNEDINAYLNHLIFSEIVPSINPEDNDLVAYAHDIVTRFKNPLIRHELKSISLNSVSKFYTRLMPSYFEYEATFNKVPSAMLLGFACLIHRYIKEESSTLNDTQEVKDAMSTWNNQGINSTVDLKRLMTLLWKDKTPKSKLFYDAGFEYLQQIKQDGIKDTFKAIYKCFVSKN